MHLTWIFIQKWQGTGTPHIKGPITHRLCLVPQQPWSTSLLYWSAIDANVEGCAGSRIWVVLTAGTFFSSSYNLWTCNGLKDSSLLGCNTVLLGCVCGTWLCFGCLFWDVTLLLGVFFWDVTLCCWVCCSGMWHCVVGCVVLGHDTVLLGVLFWNVTQCCCVCCSGMWHCVVGCVLWEMTLCCWVCCSGMWHCVFVGHDYVVGCVVLGCDTVLLGC